MKFDKTGVYRTSEDHYARITHFCMASFGYQQFIFGYVEVAERDHRHGKWIHDGTSAPDSQYRGDLIELIHEVKFPEPPKVIVDGPGLYEFEDGERYILKGPDEDGHWRAEAVEFNDWETGDVDKYGKRKFATAPCVTRKLVDFETLTIIKH